MQIFENNRPALYEVDFDHNGFEWIDFHDVNSSIISFIRKAKDPKNYLIFICNFTPVPRFQYRIGVPEKTFYKEILNSESEIYGGCNLGNIGGIRAESVTSHSRQFSINLTIPPLSVLIFRPANDR